MLSAQQENDLSLVKKENSVTSKLNKKLERNTKAPHLLSNLKRLRFGKYPCKHHRQPVAKIIITEPVY